MNARLYLAPATLGESLAAVREHGRDGVVAGGTDAMVNHRSGKRTLPDAVISIHRLDALRGLGVERGGALRAGALVTHADLTGSPDARARFTALADGSAIVGSPATRAAGTLGGNLVNASPAMDLGAPLLVFGASAELESHTGRRTVAMADLWTGPGQSVLTPDELLTGVTIPALPPRSGSAYVRLEYRRAMEIAVVGVACAITLAEDDVVVAARVALTAVGPTCFVADEAGRVLIGHRPDGPAVDAAGAAAADAARPISDNRASDTYRRHMVAVMTGRAVLVAAARARGRSIAVPATQHWRDLETVAEVAG